MNVLDTNDGWYFKRRGDTSDNQGGPYTWPDLVSYARQGILAADDFVWHPSLPAWDVAASIPGLFAQPVATQPAPAPPAPVPAILQSAPMPAQPASPQRPESRAWLVIAAVAAAIVVLGAVGGGAWWLIGRGAGSGPDLGEASAKVPDSATLVTTKEWGEVPAGQIGVTLAEGGKRKDAEKFAEELGGSVVGEIEFLDMFQIEFPGKTEADLAVALSKAEANEKFELACPNNQAYGRIEIWGVRQDPYEDPMYAGAVGDNYRTLGVSKAWNYIRGSGIELSEVNVGVVDDGLHIQGEGAESEFGGEVKIEYPDGEENGKLSAPRVSNGKANKAGSHGTGVATIIAGDPNNGGPSGIAGPLGKKLTLSVTNYGSGKYGDTTSTPDPNDPTKAVFSDGKTYAIGDLVAIKNQIEKGATVINCSWGADVCHPGVAAIYKKFFEKMAAEHDDVIFVCAAGNTNQTALDNRTSFPCGHSLSNMITVAAVDNDGNPAGYTTVAGANYVVDIAATGTDATVGLDANGGPVQQSGTSFASPEVAAAAAMLKAIDPDLKAADVKRILTATARTKIKTGENEVATPASVGGKVLAIDEAVFAALNEKRKAEGLSEMSKEEMENAGVVDAVATTGEPGEYAVRGIVKGPGGKNAELSISVSGENHVVGGTTRQSVAAPGESSWGVTLPKEKGTIKVTRTDNGAASLIVIERGALEGTWQWPEIWRLPGMEPQKTGGTITYRIVRDGDGYAIPDEDGNTVTLKGDQVKIVHRYSGILPGEPGGVSVLTGTLQGDEIHGVNVDTYNKDTPWDAVRVK